MLAVGEKLVYKAKIHWLIFMPGVFFILLGLATIPYAMTITFPFSLFPLGFIIAALPKLIQAFIYYYFSEFACSNRAFYTKVGFISRHTQELQAHRIEGVYVSQTVIGRIFGYGTVTLRGIGGMNNVFPFIANPFEFRQAANSVRDAALKEKQKPSPN